MTKTRTTKKPAAKPQRKPRKTPTTPATAEDIGRSIGDALGRRLENLLAKPDNPGFDAVAGWTVENLGDGVNGYRANYATDTGLMRISPVDEAIGSLRSAIIHAETITDMETERLQSVLAPTLATPTDGGGKMSAEAASLANVLQTLAERIHADNYRRANMLDRLEL